MSSETKLPFFLFYEEPDPDRWFPSDRYPRRLIRRLVRGPARPGGVMRWFLNLQAGLDRLGLPYRLNDYRGLHRRPGAVAHVVGKPQVIDRIRPGHPIVFGPALAAHPSENDFWGRPDLSLILVSCEWFRLMYERDLPRPIPTAVWPAGVETDLWRPPVARPRGRVLVYDKVRWRRDELVPGLVDPILARLRAEGLEPVHLRYGHYREEDFRSLLDQVGAMIFLCEHETQGFAYLQALSCGVPIFAWDRGGLWQDPGHFPHRVRFGPVSSVPYFDARCGERFTDLDSFQSGLASFLRRAEDGAFRPRDYVVENFDLATQARRYLQLVSAVAPRS